MLLLKNPTEAYETARDKIAKFVNVKNRQELIFVRGTTEAINLLHMHGDDLMSMKVT